MLDQDCTIKFEFSVIVLSNFSHFNFFFLVIFSYFALFKFFVFSVINFMLKYFLSLVGKVVSKNFISSRLGHVEKFYLF